MQEFRVQNYKVFQLLRKKENGIMARTRKTIAEKKRNGTFKPSRDGKREQTENKIIEIVGPETIAFDLPSEIHSKEIISFYKWHTHFLNQLHIITPADIPTLNQMYLTLQQITDIDEQLHKTDLTKDFETYSALTKLRIRLCTLFNQVATQFYITPTARAKLTLDHLEIEKKQSENNQSVIGKLIQAKRNSE